MVKVHSHMTNNVVFQDLSTYVQHISNKESKWDVILIRFNIMLYDNFNISILYTYIHLKQVNYHMTHAVSLTCHYLWWHIVPSTCHYLWWHIVSSTYHYLWWHYVSPQCHYLRYYITINLTRSSHHIIVKRYKITTRWFIYSVSNSLW